MSPELPPFLPTNARARAAAAKARSRRVASPLRARPGATAETIARRGALAIFAVGTFLLAWYSVSVDQEEQQMIREQTARIRSIAPGP